MAQHVKILGILHIVFGGLGVLGAIVVLLIFGGLSALVGMSDHSSDSAAAVPILGVIGIFAFIFVMVLSLPGLIIGIGLVRFRPWARIAAIILSAFDLFGVPFHTALGIYGLWVLLNREAEQMFAAPPLRAA
ncbi:MAG TPA: hypothetical protein VK724_06320 [Bryobacteraceae bacterium]|jgi:hypothetical protein|nr:hypothetical protein [Bryobacteraceae bacterium]